MQKSPSGALVDLIRGRFLAPIGVRGRHFAEPRVLPKVGKWLFGFPID